MASGALVARGWEHCAIRFYHLCATGRRSLSAPPAAPESVVVQVDGGALVPGAARCPVKPFFDEPSAGVGFCGGLIPVGLFVLGVFFFCDQARFAVSYMPSKRPQKSAACGCGLAEGSSRQVPGPWITRWVHTVRQEIKKPPAQGIFLFHLLSTGAFLGFLRPCTNKCGPNPD